MNNKFDSSILFKSLDEKEQEKISGGVTGRGIIYPVIVRSIILNTSEAQAYTRGSKVRIM